MASQSVFYRPIYALRGNTLRWIFRHAAWPCSPYHGPDQLFISPFAPRKPPVKRKKDCEHSPPKRPTLRRRCRHTMGGRRGPIDASARSHIVVGAVDITNRVHRHMVLVGPILVSSVGTVEVGSSAPGPGPILVGAVGAYDGKRVRRHLVLSWSAHSNGG